MEALPETLNEGLYRWNSETADHVREGVTEIIGLADQDALDLRRSRACEQAVPDVPDELAPRWRLVCIPSTTQNRKISYEVPLPKLTFLIPIPWQT